MKTALVTGASAGFGQEICRKLINNNYKVIGAARRIDKLQNLANELGHHFLPLALDVTNTEMVNRFLQQLPDNFKTIDILINNAGLALGIEPAYKTDYADWQTMINTNITGLAHLTHTILPSMVTRNTGYIINLGSIAGNYPYEGGNVYGASKAFVKQFSANLRTDLFGKNIRITNIEPGLCGGTEFSNVRFHGDHEQANALYENVDFLTAKDIADTVLWLLSTPPHFNVNHLEIMPVSQVPAGLKVSKRH